MKINIPIWIIVLAACGQIFTAIIYPYIRHVVFDWYNGIKKLKPLNQEIAKTYGATRTPHMYILQKDDKNLVVKYVGAIDDNSDDAGAVTKKYLENALDEVIAGKDVTTSSTKAIGCTIKWNVRLRAEHSGIIG